MVVVSTITITGTMTTFGTNVIASANTNYIIHKRSSGIGISLDIVYVSIIRATMNFNRNTADLFLFSEGCHTQCAAGSRYAANVRYHIT